MSEGEDQDKSEQPTQYKLMRARQKGTVARGPDLAFMIALLTALAFAWFSGASIMTGFADTARAVLISGPQISDGSAALVLIPALLQAVSPLLLFFALLLLVVGLFELVQTGVVFSSQPLKPDFNRLNPGRGLKRLFSMRMLIETGKTLLKFTAYATVSFMVIRGALTDSSQAVVDGLSLARVGLQVTGRLLIAFALLATFFAAIDQIIARRQFRKSMRMSRRDVRREHRDREGDPRLKQKRRQLHGEFVKLSQSLRGIRGADVVVTNPHHIAMALRYDPKTMVSPKVVAAGTDRVALRLKKLALAYNIPVIEDVALARALHRGSALNRQIPEPLFAPVAAIYNRLRRRAGAA